LVGLETEHRKPNKEGGLLLPKDKAQVVTMTQKKREQEDNSHRHRLVGQIPQEKP
jgi:hypothetical protein